MLLIRRLPYILHILEFYHDSVVQYCHCSSIEGFCSSHSWEAFVCGWPLLFKELTFVALLWEASVTSHVEVLSWQYLSDLVCSSMWEAYDCSCIGGFHNFKRWSPIMTMLVWPCPLLPVGGLYFSCVKRLSFHMLQVLEPCHDNSVYVRLVHSFVKKSYVALVWRGFWPRVALTC